MFYFFQRREEFLRCEIRPADDGYYLIIHRPDGSELTEHYDGKEELDSRWAALQHDLMRDGWWGPHSRE